MNREIKIKVWDTVKKTMSIGMPLPMLAGYLMAIYPNLGNEVYLESTGLFDKNGTEIYQGDITKRGRKIKVVEWSKTGVGIGFNIKAIVNHGINRPVEIIGNMYQNPELLKLLN